jgi:Cu/Ag efflux protein CusF
MTWRGATALLLGLGLVVATSSPAATALSAGAITKIDPRTRMVTGYDPVSKQTFQFKVLDNVMLNEMKIGQQVFADFKAMKVALQPDRRPCCNIVTISIAGNAPPPCCSISAIHTASGIVTGYEKATGRKFQFKVMDTKLLYGLRVGQPVYANFKTMRVSVRSDGSPPCCPILSR